MKVTLEIECPQEQLDVLYDLAESLNRVGFPTSVDVEQPPETGDCLRFGKCDPTTSVLDRGRGNRLTMLEMLNGLQVACSECKEKEVRK